MRERFSDLAAWLLGVVCVGSAWCMGGRVTWMPWVFGGLAACGLVLLAAQLWVEWGWLESRFQYYLARKRRGAHPAWRVNLGRLALLSPWLLLLAQVVASVLNPAYARYTEVGGEAVFRLRDYVDWLPVTMDAERTLRQGLLLAGALIAGCVGAYSLQSRRAIRWLAAVLFANAVALGVAGTLQHFYNADLALGFVDPQTTSFFATFRYSNHWAEYAVLCLALGLGMHTHFYRERYNVRLATRANPHLLFICLAFFLMLTVPLSGSRSGVFFLILSNVLLILWHFRFSRRLRRVLHVRETFAISGAGIVAIAVFTAYLVWDIGGRPIEDRWDLTVTQFQRLVDSGDGDMRVYLARGHTIWRRSVQCSAGGWGRIIMRTCSLCPGRLGGSGTDRGCELTRRTRIGCSVMRNWGLLVLRV